MKPTASKDFGDYLPSKDAVSSVPENDKKISSAVVLNDGDVLHVKSSQASS